MTDNKRMMIMTVMWEGKTCTKEMEIGRNGDKLFHTRSIM